VPFTYVGIRSAWIQWTPEYLNDTELKKSAFGSVLRVGKMFTPRLAVSLDYSRTPVFRPVFGEIDKDYLNIWAVTAYFPFGLKN